MADITRPPTDPKNQPADAKLLQQRPELFDKSLTGQVEPPAPAVSPAPPVPAPVSEPPSHDPHRGPTLEEYMAAGYKAENYPPQGYAERPSPGLEAYRKAPAPAPGVTAPFQGGEPLPVTGSSPGASPAPPVPAPTTPPPADTVPIPERVAEVETVGEPGLGGADGGSAGGPAPDSHPEQQQPPKTPDQKTAGEQIAEQAGTAPSERPPTPGPVDGLDPASPAAGNDSRGIPRPHGAGASAGEKQAYGDARRQEQEQRKPGQPKKPGVPPR